MVRSLAIVAGCLLSVGCGSPGTEYLPSGTPTLKLEIRRASTTAVDGWEAVPDTDGQGTLYLSPQLELSNDDVVSTGVQLNDYGNWQVVMKLNEPGKQIFAKLSADLVDASNVQTQGSTSKRLAVLIDGEVIFAPVVHEPITDGVIRLGSDKFTEKDVRRIAKGIVTD
jgi:preprotein translocase subunit SecD